MLSFAFKSFMRLTVVIYRVAVSTISRCRNLVGPIKSIPSLLKVYRQADSQYAFGGAGGNRTPVQHAFASKGLQQFWLLEKGSNLRPID